MSRKRLRVAQACDVPFASMTPRREGRHCGRCDRVVADLSAMTRREAVSLYRARGGDLCGYLAHDGAGEPIHAPERAASVLASAAVATMLAACDASAPPSESVASTPVAAIATSPATPEAPMMMPLDPDAPLLSAASPGPVPGSEVAALEEIVSVGPVESPPTAEDRARERRKRAARRPPRPGPHTAFAGMMVLDDF